MTEKNDEMKILATKIILTVDGATLSDETATTTMTDETKKQLNVTYLFHKTAAA